MDGPDEEELLSIGDVAEETGITPDTIRVWERRYGRPDPVRLPSGHRRYRPAQVRWLRRVAEALARGHRASKVVPLGEDDLSELLTPEEAEGEDARWAEEQIELVRRYDGPELRRRLSLDFERLGPREFVRGRLEPLLVLVGRRWADGGLSIRHEHFLSGLLEDFLRARRLAEPEANGPKVLFATLPGETHGLGLQVTALLAVRVGARPRILGVDTPIPEIVSAAKEIRAPVVCVSISLATGGPTTSRALGALRSELPKSVSLVAGGAGARGPRRGPRGVLWAEDLVEFETILWELLSDRIGPGSRSPARRSAG